MGIDRRQHLSGRTLARTIIFPAPGCGMGAIPLTHQELIYVRISHASRRRYHGRAWTSGSARNSEGRRSLMAAERRMAETAHVVIVGGGHNGLVAAFYLAKAGFKPLVLERRGVVGGAAITEEFHPGFHCSTLAHMTAPLRAEIIRDMGLSRHGLKMMQPDVRVFAPTPDGRSLTLYGDAKKSSVEISKYSAKDAGKYLEFQKSLASLADVNADLLPITPPDVDHPSTSDLWALLKTGKKARGLGRRELYQLLRWGPMAVADLVAEWFDTELLRATIAARGIFGTNLGPWSAGSAMMLMLRTACDGEACGSAWFAQGGMGAVTQAMSAACREAGVEISTGAGVAQIRIKGGVATGVVLESGDEI